MAKNISKRKAAPKKKVARRPALVDGVHFQFQSPRGHSEWGRYVDLGQWCGYDARLWASDKNNVACLKVGCREFLSATSARRFWHGGVSKESGRLRPHHAALVDFAAAIAKTNGWKF